MVVNNCIKCGVRYIYNPRRNTSINHVSYCKKCEDDITTDISNINLTVLTPDMFKVSPNDTSQNTNGNTLPSFEDFIINVLGGNKTTLESKIIEGGSFQIKY